jgi:hypothetical protein
VFESKGPNEWTSSRPRMLVSEDNVAAKAKAGFAASVNAET